jgi:hypothetical protein
MSYTPTNWQTGDTITAEKLNNMESGIIENGELHIPLFSAKPAYIPQEKAEAIYEKIPNYTKFVFDFYNPIDVGMEAVELSVEAERLSSLSLGTNDYILFADIPYFDASVAISTQAYKEGITGVALAPANFYPGNPWQVVEENLYGGDFIVELTPTAQDFSGTMNKTPSEIRIAIDTRKRIMFSIPSMSASVEATQFIGRSVACANITYNISGQDVLVQIVTSDSDSTYSTKIFPLTPMS